MTVQEFIDKASKLNQNKPVYVTLHYAFPNGESGFGWYPITNAFRLENGICLYGNVKGCSLYDMPKYVKKYGIKLKNLISNLNTLENKDIELKAISRLRNIQVSIERVHGVDMNGADGIILATEIIKTT